MSRVTYRHQPGIGLTHGAVPLAGTTHIYTVSKVLWPAAVEAEISTRMINPSLHVCSGLSSLGDVRLDAFQERVDVRGDAAHLPFKNDSFASVLCDPPYNGKMQWNHDLLSELARVARVRIIFQHWFLPADHLGRYKKTHSFQLSDVLVWQPRTYFGRVQVVSIFDKVGIHDR